MPNSHNIRVKLPIAGAILLVIMIGCTDQPPPTPRNARVAGDGSEGALDNSQGPAEQWSPPNEPETLSLTGQEFWRITRLENPWEARQLHGRDIEIHGQLTLVARVHGAPHIFIRDGGIGPKEEDLDRYGGRFISANPQPWAAALPGQEVIAVGRYHMPANDLIRKAGVHFTTIRFTSVSGERLVLTAEELAVQFQSQPEATNEKYRGRWMEVRGEVVKVELPTEKTWTQVYLRAADDFTIQCDFSHTGEEKFANALSPGDEIRIAAQYDNYDEDELSLSECLGIEE